MLTFTDTHCHIDLDAFDSDREAVVRRAVEAGVTRMLVPNIDASGIRHLASVIDSFPGTCIPMIGLHPTSVKEDYREQMGVIEMELRQNPKKYCAVGEIGIDLYWDKTHAKEQEDVFVRQLELAEEFGLPVVIHTRNSMEVALGICERREHSNTVIRKYGNTKNEKANSEWQAANSEQRTANSERRTGVFHCFSGNLKQAERAIEMGFLLGIGGVITFKNSGLQQVVEAVPLEHLLLETDAPFLAPVPYRGQRNEPSYIPLIAERVAQLKGISVEKVASVTTLNARKLFNLTDKQADKNEE